MDVEFFKDATPFGGWERSVLIRENQQFSPSSCTLYSNNHFSSSVRSHLDNEDTIMNLKLNKRTSKLEESDTKLFNPHWLAATRRRSKSHL